eukprot:jgi/Mesen1/10669/ME000009S10464
MVHFANRVIVVDNLDNSSEEAIKRVADLAGKNGCNIVFHKVDLCDKEALAEVFKFHIFTAVIHFAGLKAVGESVKDPLKYYHNNLVGTLNLVELMAEFNCKKVSTLSSACAVSRLTALNSSPAEEGFAFALCQASSPAWNSELARDEMILVPRSLLVFSSSATVYGQPKSVPCTEDLPLTALNPYGRTKACQRQRRALSPHALSLPPFWTLLLNAILKDLHTSDASWRILLLRYFNPVGAHPSGRIGEDPAGVPNNLMPFLQQVAVGRRKELMVYGNDYPTKDGTGVRDYIHVIDLANGHVAALDKLSSASDIGGCAVYNLGTGKGTSVLEIVTAFEKACGKRIPIRMAGRRPGDASEVYASTAKAERELGWKAEYGVEEMCRDQWSWASQNPWGYRSVDEKGNPVGGAPVAMISRENSLARIAHASPVPSPPISRESSFVTMVSH